MLPSFKRATLATFRRRNKIGPPAGGDGRAGNPNLPGTGSRLVQQSAPPPTIRRRNRLFHVHPRDAVP